MMDVSGSMGDEQKEIVRIEAFWIDTWLRSQYKDLESRYIIHDAAATEVDQDDLLPPARERRHDDLARPTSCACELIEERLSAPTSGTSTPSTSPTATTGAAATPSAASSSCARSDPAARRTMFCYGQVEEPLRLAASSSRTSTRRSPGDEDLVTVADHRPRRHLRLDQGRSWGRGDDDRAQAARPSSSGIAERDRGTSPRATASTSSRSSSRCSTTDELNEVAAYGGFPTRYPALALRHGVRAAAEELRLRPVEDLRDGDQQRPLLRLPAASQQLASTRSWSWPTSTATATSSRTTSGSPRPTAR